MLDMPALMNGKGSKVIVLSYLAEPPYAMYVQTQ